jgi:hypothetical protein
MKPVDVLNIVRYQVYESTASFWSDAEIYAHMWDAEMQLAKLLKCTETSTTMTAATGTREYARPTTAIGVSRVTYNTVKLKKIDQTDVDYLEGTGYGFSGTAGNPVAYYEYGSNIGFSPIPTATDEIRVWHYQRPATITTSSSAFTIDPDLATPIADYCLHRAFAKDDNMQQASFYLDRWERGKREALAEWKRKRGNDRYSCVKDVNAYPSIDTGIA